MKIRGQLDNKINKKRRIFAGIVFLMFIPGIVFPGILQTDTISLTLKKAEEIFLEKNLQLLTQKCNVDAARAQALQNRLWDNPTISVNQNVYNTESDKNGASKWFPLSENGESSIQLQQILSIAAKRNKRIRLAEFSARKSEYLFSDLLRTLKYQLRNDFYKLYFTDATLSVYAKEIETIDTLIKAFDEQCKKGNVSKKELLRLKASLFSLENEKLTLESQRVEVQSDFNVLLHLENASVVALCDERGSDSIKTNDLTLDKLVDTAVLYRSDLKAAEADLKYNTLNVSYQKSLAIPDVQVVAGWDKNGSYVHNYNFLGIQMDVPVFNRNQGNIKSAILTCQSSRYGYESVKETVVTDVNSAYVKAMRTDSIYRQFDAGFAADFSSMKNEVLKNYEKRNIGLLEFLDYYDAYKQNIVQYNALQYSRITAFEEINYSVGKNIVAW